MPTRLTDVVIKEGALVDRGDNPRASISFWKRDSQGAPSMKTPEEIAKAHSEELAKRDAELVAVRKELADAKAEFAKELAKLAPKVEPALPANIQKRLDDAEAHAAEFKKLLAAETDARQTAEFIEKAKAIGDVPGLPAAELGPILKRMPTADADKIEKAMRAFTAQSKENAQLMKELGRAGADSPGGAEPLAKIHVLAKAYASAHKISEDVAFLEVIKSGEGRTLYNEARAAERES